MKLKMVLYSKEWFIFPGIYTKILYIVVLKTFLRGLQILHKVLKSIQKIIIKVKEKLSVNNK